MQAAPRPSECTVVFGRQQSPQRADEDGTLDEFFSFAEGTVHFYKPRVA